ncbi:MAG: SO2930 family diheme c-type cytochrome [Bacteroidota bacterium]
MIRAYLLGILCLLGGALFLMSSGLTTQSAPLPAIPQKLSDYAFFAGEMAAQKPVAGVIPYALNTPLFSDYAEKLRFVKLPAGQAAPYNAKEVLDFPVGTTIIKTFYYHKDARKPEKGRQLMETRLLIHEEKGWKALAYHWNDEQTEAYLEVAGGRKKVAWVNEQGKKQKLEYSFPNLNQCKGCHSYEGDLKPIGPSVRQLNGDHAYETGTHNQLAYWEENGWLQGLPDQDVPRMAVWNDPATGSLDERARAWLDINCAHCHRAEGPAYTSGFFLDIHQTDPTTWGVRKAPVAAGRGSGGRTYDIEPGNADASILYFRIISEDPGIMMPEVGRQVVHKEGVALIREWINQLSVD